MSQGEELFVCVVCALSELEQEKTQLQLQAQEEVLPPFTWAKTLKEGTCLGEATSAERTSLNHLSQGL